MRAPRHIPLIVAAGALLAAGSAATADQPVFEHCRLEGHRALPTVDARCARIDVPLDPTGPAGETLSLHVARVPATTATPLPDPLVVISGGPGQGSAEFYTSVHGAFAPVRRQREILVIDQRGTGLSRPQRCPDYPDTGVELDLETVLPEAVRDCLDALDADPRLFTTSVAVRDLEAVREALGLAELNLYGVSYGTRVAQHYARRHPDSTRALVLDAVLPPALPLGPDIPTLSHRAVLGALERCADEEACAAAFPGAQAHPAELLASLDDTPRTVSYTDPLSGEPREGQLSGNEVRLALRMLAYSAETVALLPLLLHQAAQGHYGPLKAQAAMIIADLDSLATAMHNSVVCTEDVPFWNVSDEHREALAATYLGTLPVDALAQTCALWPEGVLDEDLHEPLRGNLPVLVLSGEHDPITPPDYGDTVLTSLDNARHVVAPGQGHGVIGQGCVPRVVARFLQDTDPTGLATDCVDRLAAAPFFLSPAGPGP